MGGQWERQHRQTLRASMSFSLAHSTAATGEAGTAAEVGQVQLGLTSTRRHGEYANLLLCSKRFEFSFKDMQMVYLKSPSLSFFLSTFRAEKYSFKFLLLFETEWGNSTQKTFGSKWLWGDEGELTHCLLQCLFLASKRHRDANLIFFSVLHDFALVVNYLGEIIISTLGKTRHNVSVLAELVLSMSKT